MIVDSNRYQTTCLPIRKDVDSNCSRTTFLPIRKEATTVSLDRACYAYRSKFLTMHPDQVFSMRLPYSVPLGDGSK